uniref:ORF3 n=1 Tax=Torque teno Leptonychotes weddellii virus-1 TaxID=2012676 RepID=A0A1Z2RWC6_9VIRU|nr:ORF3 [Torque teno Leptonychotes weddellii virus 1]
MDLAQKYRLVPYTGGRDHSPPQTSSQGTSTNQASSQKELIKELLDLIEISSQPDWGMSPPTSPPESESDSGSLMGSESESEQDSSSEFYWEDEENPGGEGPPLIPPP